MVTCTRISLLLQQSVFNPGLSNPDALLNPSQYHLIFHAQANQWAPNKSASPSSGKHTGAASSLGMLPPYSGECSHLCPTAAPLPCRSPWPVLTGKQMTNLQLLGSLSSKHWVFGLAEHRKSQEAQSCDPDGRAMLSSEDGSLLFSASPATGCGFQFHGAQGSWLFLGCLRSKRKQRLSFLVTLLCLAVLQNGGSLFRYSPSPAAGQGRQWSSRRKCLGFACPPYPPLFLRRITGFMQGKNKFALNGGDGTSPKQREWFHC